MAILTGWSRNKRPFGRDEFKNAALSEHMSYDRYLTAYGQQSKSKKLRKTL